jgi:hypothetical protein
MKEILLHVAKEALKEVVGVVIQVEQVQPFTERPLHEARLPVFVVVLVEGAETQLPSGARKMLLTGVITAKSLTCSA